MNSIYSPSTKEAGLMAAGAVHGNLDTVNLVGRVSWRSGGLLTASNLYGLRREVVNSIQASDLSHFII